jgi:UDP-hydrolysing UDP-N-acetyl-D-glucosamine 2-epimerase
MAERKICVVTGSRAEYGLLYWLMKEIEADPDLKLQLVVTGTHLSAQFGDTWKVIEDDGFAIDAKVDIDIGDDTPVGVSRSLGLCVAGMAEAFDKLAPDIVVVLGDRYEILAAAEAAMIARIPIGHIHGGEVTEGAMDDAMRHAITKLASLHFVAAEEYRQRVVQLGEDPDQVFNVGAPGIDNILKLDLMPLPELERDLGLDLADGFFLVTYHPATLGEGEPGAESGEMLLALDEFRDHKVIVTGVNADPGHDRIAGLLSDYANRHPKRVTLHASLGQVRYLSAMKHAAAVIGNSSSGIIEAPALGVPTVNVGDRQKGRLLAPSVIDCSGEAKAISSAIARALNPEFRAGLGDMALPYGEGGASRKIKDRLKATDLSLLARKHFYDAVVERAAS